jgi:hypothetical protein
MARRGAIDHDATGPVAESVDARAVHRSLSWFKSRPGLQPSLLALRAQLRLGRPAPTKARREPDQVFVGMWGPGYKSPFRRHMVFGGIREPDMDLVTFIVLVLNIWTAVMSYRTAERRGRSVKAWLWLGVIFGPFAWLTVALLPPIQKERAV